MDHALIYFAVFGASLAVDLIPFIGPPAWMAMVFFLMKYNLNPWLVLAAGVPGSVLGTARRNWSRPLTAPDAFLKRTLRSPTSVRMKRFARIRIASVLPHPLPVKP